MTTTDKRKRSLYFPDNILREMQVEAKRQERSLSWIVQYAWRIARNELMRLPSVGEPGFVESHELEDDIHEEESNESTHHSESSVLPNTHITHHGR